MGEILGGKLEQEIKELIKDQIEIAISKLIKELIEDIEYIITDAILPKLNSITSKIIKKHFVLLCKFAIDSWEDKADASITGEEKISKFERGDITKNNDKEKIPS